MDPRSAEILEARLVAQRKLLGMLVAELEASGAGGRLWDFLGEAQVLQDNQEDPGAVPTEELAFSLAVTNEFRLLAEAARRGEERRGGREAP